MADTSPPAPLLQERGVEMELGDTPDPQKGTKVPFTFP